MKNLTITQHNLNDVRMSLNPDDDRTVLVYVKSGSIRGNVCFTTMGYFTLYNAWMLCSASKGERLLNDDEEVVAWQELPTVTMS